MGGSDKWDGAFPSVGIFAQDVLELRGNKKTIGIDVATIDRIGSSKNVHIQRVFLDIAVHNFFEAKASPGFVLGCDVGRHYGDSDVTWDVTTAGKKWEIFFLCKCCMIVIRVFSGDHVLQSE